MTENSIIYVRQSPQVGWVDICIMKKDGLDVTSIKADKAIRLSSRMLEEGLTAQRAEAAAQTELSVDHPAVKS